MGEDGIAWTRTLHADCLLCINSTTVLPTALLDVFHGQALNCHPGLLPEYGGLHAHQWAIREGAREYGATVHRMEAAVDAGAIVAIARFPIRDSDTGLTLFRTTMGHAIALMTSVAARLAAEEVLDAAPQDQSARRMYRRGDARDGRIDWRLPARAVVNFVRAGNYEPFRSPTYTATFATPFGRPVEILRCEVAGLAPGAPGMCVDLHPDGPLIACGDGNAVRVTRARNESGLVDLAAWRRLLAGRQGKGVLPERAFVRDA